jgi:hypothetical protein
VLAFHQRVRDEKMLEKLTTHDIQDVIELFSLVDKCARATEDRAWHTPPAIEVGKVGKPDASIAVQGGGSKNNKKKKAGCRGPRGNKNSRQASSSNDGGVHCPVHNSTRHDVGECWEIRKLTEQFREKQQQLRQEGAPSRQWEGKQKVNLEEENDEEMEFQKAKRDLKPIYGHSNSDSSDNEHRKTLHIIFEGSWDITS